MRGTYRTLGLILVLGAAGLTGCLSPEEHEEAAVQPTSLAERAQRRAYDGAPPVIPHEPLGMGCTECHGTKSMAVEDLGVAPASPHEDTPGISNMARCQQCHVFQRATDEFARSGFRPGSPRGNSRLFEGAPPTMPHDVFMRENCNACHSGPAARPEILTTHPERARCMQCHVPVQSSDVFPPPRSDGS